MIRESVESRPTRSARNRNEPFRFIVPLTTRSPGAFPAGTLSPVTLDSSTVPPPLTTTPSAGIDDPGRMTTMSPTASSSAGISASDSPRTTHAVFGERFMRRDTASVVRRFARASRYFPNVTSSRIMPAVSK